jgi:integrase
MLAVILLAMHVLLRIATGQALKWGLVARNVATLVDPPPTKREPVSPLTPDEARVFLEAIRGDRFEALFVAALALGLRLGEALGLGWNDIDFEKRTLAVRYALQRINKQLVRTDLKRDTSGRTLPLPDHTLAVLRAHRANQLEEKLKAGRNWQDSELVFTTYQGNPLDGRNVLRHFQNALNRAGLRHQRFHDLRHACASLLLAQGVSPKVVQTVLGHTDIRLTMNTYAHVMPSMQRDAADVMDAFLSGQK